MAGRYAEHLLAGGIARWQEFLDAAHAAHLAGAAGAEPRAGSWTGEPPGAAQAELLRRFNRRAGEPPGRELGERVLRRAAPGRGRVDLLLCDPPERVALAELLRVGAGVLADLVAELPLPAEALEEVVAPPPVVARRRGPTYRLEGPPLTVAALRRRLTAAGLPPRRAGRWRSLWRRPDVVLVVALPLHRGLAEVWSRRVQKGATRSWPTVLSEWHRARRLPPGASYDRLAAWWAGRIGAARVHVVTGDDLDGQVAAVLGVRPAAEAPRTAPPAVPALLPPAYVEVVRRTSEVLTFRVPAEEKRERLDVLVGLLTGPTGDGPPGPGGSVAVSPRQRRWLRRSGRRSASRLEAGGYVLHAPLAPLGRGGDAGPAAAGRQARRDRAVLAALLESVLRAEAARVRAEGGRGTTWST